MASLSSLVDIFSRYSSSHVVRSFPVISYYCWMGVFEDVGGSLGIEPSNDTPNGVRRDGREVPVHSSVSVKIHGREETRIAQGVGSHAPFLRLLDLNA